MQKTEHLNLNQWEPTDPIRREDFNADNAAIDAALGAVASVPKIAVGTYTGDDTANRTIELGFTPKAVYVCLVENITYQSSSGNRWYYGGLAVSGSPASADNVDFLAITEGGFRVIYDNSSVSNVYYMTNSSKFVFQYAAIG